MAEAERRQWHARLARAWQQARIPMACHPASSLACRGTDDARLLDSSALTLKTCAGRRRSSTRSTKAGCWCTSALRVPKPREETPSRLGSGTGGWLDRPGTGALLRAELHIDAGQPTRGDGSACRPDPGRRAIPSGARPRGVSAGGPRARSSGSRRGSGLREPCRHALASATGQYRGPCRRILREPDEVPVLTGAVQHDAGKDVS